MKGGKGGVLDSFSRAVRVLIAFKVIKNVVASHRLLLGILIFCDSTSDKIATAAGKVPLLVVVVQRHIS